MALSFEKTAKNNVKQCSTKKNIFLVFVIWGLENFKKFIAQRRNDVFFRYKETWKNPGF